MQVFAEQRRDHKQGKGFVRLKRLNKFEKLGNSYFEYIFSPTRKTMIFKESQYILKIFSSRTSKNSSMGEFDKYYYYSCIFICK